MVLGLNPMGKPTTWEKNRGFGQNHDIVWSSDSSLLGNQLPEKKQRFWTKPRHCLVLGLKPMGKPTSWEKTKVLDRTRALYGPRTQACGESNYLRKNKGFGQNQVIVRSSDSSLWGNQLPVKNTKVFNRTMALYGPWTQAYGETNNLRKKQRFWTEPRHCIVLGLKPMGKPTTWEKTSVLDRTKELYGPWIQAYGETNYLRKNKNFGRNQGIVWSSDSSLRGNQLPERKNKGFG